MLGAAWMNLGSLVLGLIAWILPVAALARRGRAGQKSFAALSFSSVGACAASLCLQIFYADHLAKIRDWSAIADTSGAVAFAAATLLAVTLALNAAALALYNRKKAGG
ncbi:MAG TPA: hypothetical protein VN366_07600 [Feifaniaceae bacterium]|nr:hypothetical protein [Feifaniaceae bacterium]